MVKSTDEGWILANCSGKSEREGACWGADVGGGNLVANESLVEAVLLPHGGLEEEARRETAPDGLDSPGQRQHRPASQGGGGRWEGRTSVFSPQDLRSMPSCLQ